jgi:hypothetical protein
MNFIKKILGKNENEENESSGNFVVATLNDKVMPIDRGEIYEDPLNNYIQTNEIGEVTGGGTMQQKTGEIEFCDIEIQLINNEIKEEHITSIINKLEELGAPKGSKLKIEKTQKEIYFGKKEGIGIYLDGINLPDQVYADADIDYLAEELNKKASPHNIHNRNWTGNEESGLYYYSDSFEKMKTEIQDIINNYPLCEGARIERIA